MLFTLWGNYDNFPWNMMTIENSVMYTWKGRVTATLKPFSFVPMFEIVKAQVKATWNRIRGGTCQNYWSSTADPEKKESQPLDCFQFVKVGASFYISPFPFSPYSFFELNLFGSTSGCPLYFSPSVTWAGHKASTLLQL